MKILKIGLIVAGTSILLTACGGDGSDKNNYSEVTRYPVADTFEKIYSNFSHYTLYAQGKDYKGWKMMVTTQPGKQYFINGKNYLTVSTITESEVDGISTGRTEVEGFVTTNPFEIVSDPLPRKNHYKNVVDSHAFLPKIANLDQSGDFFTSSTYDPKGVKVQETRRTWYLHKVSYNRANLCTKTVITSVKKAGLERDKTATVCYEIDKDGSIYRLQVTVITAVDGELQVVNFES
ncbi:hypothetical protein [Psychrobacter sp. I-STPA10]|uniref:hypothetical protein n=1 Tax=Psychrobacter sp. I-STPA10 TaxID=2585769 RepID=UPI001E30BD83|nr:hypothetical protein [Psychrobacter sp. I-STPA10]